MSMFERFGRVVKSELGHLVRRAPAAAPADATPGGAEASRTRPFVSATVARRASGVVDVAGAMRVLELSGAPALADVRTQYRALARRYHPLSKSALADEALAARVVLDALSDALELLEEHLLPV